MRKCCEPYVCTSHAQVSACLKMKKNEKKEKGKKKGNINVANEILQLNNSVHKLLQQRRHRRVIK